MRNQTLALCVLLAGSAAFAQQQPAGAASSSSSAAPASTAPAIQPPAHPITDAQAREMMEITGASNLKKLMVVQMLPYLERSLPPNAPDDVKKDLETSMQNADVDSVVIHTYQEYLSTDDATSIIAFYKSPAGKQLLTVQQPMSREVIQKCGKLGQQIGQDVVTRHKAELDALQKQPSSSTPGSTAPGTAPATSTPAKPQH